jgi:hypothetical protein
MADVNTDCRHVKMYTPLRNLNFIQCRTNGCHRNFLSHIIQTLNSCTKTFIQNHVFNPNDRKVFYDVQGITLPYEKLMKINTNYFTGMVAISLNVNKWPF